MIKSASQSSLTNDVKYRSMSVGKVPSSEFLIETVLLGANAASVAFNDLGQYAGVYRHLQIVATTRDTNSFASLGFRFNGDSGNNYARHSLQGNGSTVTSGAGASESAGFLGGGANSGTTSGNFTALIIDILDPFNSLKNTTVRTMNGATGHEIGLHSTVWLNTSSLTSFNVFSRAGGNLAQHSRFSLYGVTA